MGWKIARGSPRPVMNILVVWSMSENWEGISLLAGRAVGREHQIPYLAANDGTHAVGNMVDDAVDQRQVVRGHADGANEEMAVTTACLEQIHVQVVHIGARGILDLGTEGVGNVVGEGRGRDGAGRGDGGPGEQGREGSAVHHGGSWLDG